MRARFPFQRRTTSYGRRQLQVPHLVSNESPDLTEPPQKKFLVAKNTNSRPATRGTRPHILPPHPEPDPDPVSRKLCSRKTHARQSTASIERIDHQPLDTDTALNLFLNKASTVPLCSALEEFFKEYFQARAAYVWQEIPDLQMLYNQTTQTTLSHSSGLVGYSFFSRGVVRCGNGPAHPSYHANTDSRFCPFNAPVLLFPLWDYHNSLVYVVEVVRSPQDVEFNQDDEGFTHWFASKFKLLSRWIKPQLETEPLVLEMLQLMTDVKFYSDVIPLLQKFFDVRAFEIWKLDKSNGKLSRYTDKCEVMDPKTAGIVGDALLREEAVNCTNSRLNSSYAPETDGETDEAVYVLPVLEQEGQVVYGLVMRGPKSANVFRRDDGIAIKKLAPIILLSLTNMEVFTARDNEYRTGKMEREGLAVLLEVAEVLSSQLDTERLIGIIMEKGRMLTSSDRCSLFLVNETRDRLITSLHQGLSNAIDIPINKGIAGKSVVEGRVFNIPDAYETDFFDPSTDQETGYRTRSLLSLPIYNTRAEIIGVTQMVNKLNGQPFSQWDMKLIQIFNVFCGISLENARLFKEATAMSDQLKSFFDISFSISRSDNIQRLLLDIMTKAKTLIGADSASIFMVDETADVLSTFVSTEEKMPLTVSLSIGVAARCVKTKEGIFVNDPYNSQYFNRAVDNVTGYRTRSILVVPIIASGGTVLGVVEMINKQNGDFVSKDLHTLTAFAQFAAIALENSRLKDIAHLGDEELEMKKWIGPSEREGFEIPKNLVLPDDKRDQVNRLDCFAVDYTGIGHFKEIFYFYNKFHILEQFNVTNEQLFRFIFTISATYNQVPYHNWTHACDVTQYVTYEVSTAGLDKVFTSQELFGLLTAAVCHDANHEGLNNVFNVKAETPFGILFKDQSVMEMHHITVAIPIITRDDINLFHALTPDQTKQMWNLFIQLILATDMARHFELVKGAQAMLDENKWDINTPECRLLALKLILKVADISNVSRPFGLADNWCDILCNEFFRQGDLEKETGIGLTSPLNDRENSDKPKSQIGFYNFICLPLYQVVARIFPPLQVNADSVKSNLEKWKTLAAS